MIKHNIYKHITLLLIFLVSICIIICSIIIGIIYHQHNQEHNMQDRSIHVINSLKMIQHQYKNSLITIKYNKHANHVTLYFTKQNRTNAYKAYPLYLKNLELNREEQVNNKINITNNFTIQQSQILSKFNDQLATLNYQQHQLKRTHTSLSTNIKPLTKALNFDKKIKSLNNYINPRKKLVAAHMLTKNLNHTLFSKHIKISKYHNILQVKAKENIVKKAIANKTNNNYEMRNQLYQNVLQNMIEITHRIHNPFIIIKISNISIMH